MRGIFLTLTVFVISACTSTQWLGAVLPMDIKKECGIPFIYADKGCVGGIIICCGGVQAQPDEAKKETFN